MVPFSNLKQKQKIHNLHDNILDLKVHFESKLILIQWLNEEDWIKTMYIKHKCKRTQFLNRISSKNFNF
jgi:hypothetical protein